MPLGLPILTQVGQAVTPPTMTPHETDKDGSSRAPLDELFDRYARGADGLFDELYRRAAPGVRGFLARLCSDVALADDLTQETFLRVHRARQSFVAGSAAMPWLLAIARNAFRDYVRRETVRGGHAATISRDRNATAQAPPETQGDQVLAARELAGIVGATLAGLPLEHREAFILIRFEGLSVSEAAAVMGASESAVKTRAFRAYQSIRAALACADMDPRVGQGNGGNPR